MTDKEKKYEDAGKIFRLDPVLREVEDGHDYSLTDDNLRNIVKCTGCGALVTGGLSRERHDEFHQALADLWEMLENKE